MELIYKDTARRIIDSPRTKEQMLRMLEATPPAQPDHHIAEVSKMVDADLVSRADVEQTVEDNILCYTHSDRPIDQDPDTECHKAIRTALKMLRKDLRKLPSAQPVLTCKGCKYDYYEYAGCRNCLRRERDLYEPE